MQQLDTYCESFALRQHELVQVVADSLDASDRRCWFAIQARTVSVPFGSQPSTSWPYALVACRLNDSQEWDWLPLAVYTKEALGNLLLTVPDFKPDYWYYCIVIPPTEHNEYGTNDTTQSDTREDC